VRWKSGNRYFLEGLTSNAGMLHRGTHRRDALRAAPGDDGGVATAAGYSYLWRHKVLVDAGQAAWMMVVMGRWCAEEA